MRKGNILGFDFGTKRIGIAVGQTITATARALQVIRAEQGVPDWKALDKLMQEWQPVMCVVGLPLNMDSSTQPITERAEQFAATLHERYHIPIEMADERLSTREARDRIFEEGGYRKLISQPVDGMAAQIILAQWLEQDRDDCF